MDICVCVCERERDSVCVGGGDVQVETVSRRSAEKVCDMRGLMQGGNAFAIQVCGGHYKGCVSGGQNKV
jgi:hypothetical protein